MVTCQATAPSTIAEHGPQLRQRDVPAAADQRDPLPVEPLSQLQRSGERGRSRRLDELARRQLA